MKRLKLTIAAVGGVVLGAALAIWGVVEVLEARKLAADSLSVTATVVGGASNKVGASARSEHIDIEFETEAGEVRKERVYVDDDVYDAAESSGTVTVHYLPSDPSTLQVGDKVETRYGTILTGVAMICAGLFCASMRGMPQSREEAPAWVLNRLNDFKYAAHEYTNTELGAFPEADREFYENGSATLKGLGFEVVGDLEDLTFAKAGMKVMFRLHSGRNQEWLATLYHHIPGKMMQMAGQPEVRVLDLETMLSDGRFMRTSNAKAEDKSYPPELLVLHLGQGVEIEAVIAAHDKRLNEYLEANPGVSCAVLRTDVDRRKAQNIMGEMAAFHELKTRLLKQALSGVMKEVNEQSIQDLALEVEDLRRQSDTLSSVGAGRSSESRTEDSLESENPPLTGRSKTPMRLNRGN